MTSCRTSEPTSLEPTNTGGASRAQRDPSWKLDLVGDLTNYNERQVRDPESSTPWEVSDAPDDFIDGQLKAIVGVQVEITKIEAKRKLSQNRQADDRLGAQTGLGRSDRPSDLDASTAMRSIGG